MKFSSLSGYGGGGILQLVGRCGACAIHTVGGHVCPVSGGIILGVLVLAKRRIRGIILQRITWIMSSHRHSAESWDKGKERRRKIEMFHFSGKVQTDFWWQILQVFPRISLIFYSLHAVFYIFKTIKALCCCFLLTQWRWALLWVSSLNLSLHPSLRALINLRILHECAHTHVHKHTHTHTHTFGVQSEKCVCKHAYSHILYTHRLDFNQSLSFRLLSLFL